MSSTIAGRVRQQLGQLDADWPCWRNWNGEASSLPVCVWKWTSSLPGYGLPCRLRQLGLGVEQVHLARPAVLEQADDGLRPRPGGAAASARAGRARRRAGLGGQQVGQGQRRRGRRRSGPGRRGGSSWRRSRHPRQSSADPVIRRTGRRCSPGASGTSRPRPGRRRPSRSA